VALKIIKEDLGAEVARISLTLLPNEPASVDSPSLHHLSSGSFATPGFSL
jgi:hypothetical protein